MKWIISVCLVLIVANIQAQTIFKDKNGKFGLKAEDGTILLAGKYDMVKHPKTGAFEKSAYEAVMLNGKWGYIDKEGKEVLALKYDYACNFIEGISHVKLGKSTYFIDTTGKKLTPALDYQQVFCMFDGFAAVTAVVGKKIKWGLIDETGEEVLRTEHDVQPQPKGQFSDGLLCVGFYKKGKGFQYGYANKEGILVVAPKFDEAEPFKNGKAKVTKGKKTFFIDKNGKKLK